jgi:hypothetical protein
VSIGTRVVGAKLLLGKVTVRIVVNDIRWVYRRVVERRFELIERIQIVHDFIGVIKAVRNQIPTFEVGYTLPTITCKVTFGTGRMSTEVFVRLVLAVRAEVAEQRVGYVTPAIPTRKLKDGNGRRKSWRRRRLNNLLVFRGLLCFV